MHEVCTGLTTKGQPHREFPARLSFCDSVSVGRVVCLCLGVLALFQNFNCAGDGPGDGHAHKPRVLRDRKQLVRAKGNACERLYWYTTGRFFPIGWAQKDKKAKRKRTYSSVTGGIKPSIALRSFGCRMTKWIVGAFPLEIIAQRPSWIRICKLRNACAVLNFTV